MIKEVKKLWQGKYVSLRDYEVYKCQKLGQDMIVKYNGKTMTIPNQDLDKGIVNNKPIQSKFKGKYFLIDYTWKPLWQTKIGATLHTKN